MRRAAPLWVRWGRWALSALVVLAIFGGLMRMAQGAVTVGGTYGTRGTASSLTWSATMQTGSNRVLTVRVVNMNTAVTVTNVTFNGAALTYLTTATSGSGSGHVRATVWYMVAPPAITANVVVTLSASAYVVASTLDFTGVSQTTPFGAISTSSGNTPGPASLTIAANSGDVISDLLSASGAAVMGFTAGGGQSYVYEATGTNSIDVLGATSTKAATGSTTFTYDWTNTAPWVLLGYAVKPAGASITGTVFEDKNYGGGAGRDLATANANGGGVVSGATVELYSSTGVFVSSTTTDSSGGYTFSGLASSTNYFVRVASTTVDTTRSCNNSCGGTLAVLTYRTTATSGTAVAVTDWVGGTNPAAADPGTASAGATFNTSTYVYSAGLSGTAHAVAPVTTSSGTTATSNVDFGYSFNVITNNNNSGQGSLRQFIANANEIISAGLAISGGVANLDNAIFMISNGSTAAGLRSTYNYFSGGVTTITLTSAFPTVIGCVIDARKQPGWSGTPVVVLSGSGLSGSIDGFQLDGQTTIGGVALAGFTIRNFPRHGVNAYGNGNAIKGNWIGLSSAGTAAAANGGDGIYIGAGSSNDAIGGTAAYEGNVTSGNSGSGIHVLGSNTTVQGNVTGLNAAGTAAVPNGGDGITLENASSVTVGGSSSAARNVISGNTATYAVGIWISYGSGHTIKGNWIGLNTAGTATIGNNYAGIDIAGSSSNTIGGTAAGEGNVITGNGGNGIDIRRQNNGSTNVAATGNKISGNSSYNNTGLGIDLGDDGVTANNGSTTTTVGNQGMDFPVFTTATLSDTTLTVAGYVGSAANQTAFANAVVEVFVADVTTAGNGEGKTYLGSVTADANGNFSGTVTGVTGVTGGSTRITGTARNGSNDTSEFGANVAVTQVSTISGTVFEDVNYGGGAGRNQATAMANGGAVRSGVRVELYTVSGTTATMSVAATTDASGNYSFSGLANGNYAVRVVSSTVTSSRTGAVNTLIAVTTYRATGASGTAVDVTNEVGGTGPSVTGFYNAQATVGASSSTTSSYAEAFSLVTVNNAAVPDMDFGYNFNTVTNVNATGQGSLRQVITNANTLGGDSALAQSGRTAGIENVVFMISNGSTAAGLRSSNNYFVGGVATIAPTSALPTISSPLLLDAQTQPGWTANPIIELNGTSAGTSVDGLLITGAGSTVRGLVINRFKRHGLYVLAANATVQGCWIGVNNAGSAASANTLDGIYAAYTGHTIGGTGSTQRNLVSGNTRYGITLAADGGSAGNSTVAGNYVGTNLAGSGALANGSNGVYVLTTGNTVGGAVSGAGNLISGNGLNGVQIDAATNTVQGNTIGLNLAGTSALANASHGIYVGGGSGQVIGGGSSLQRNVVSGNASGGVFINTGGSHTIQGNYIGTNAAGTAAIGNASYFGLEVYGSGSNQIGGTTAGQGNVISGQSGAGKGGVYLAANSNTLQGNFIGTNAAGSAGLANAGPGIAIAVGSVISNTIGGTATGAGNTIAYNGQQGVVVSGASATGNKISRNAIHSNTGIGIDIAAAGRNANNGSKTATLGNQEMDTPVISSTQLSGVTFTLAGYVGSAASQATFASATVEVFKVLSDGTGYGQAQTYLGTLTADASGNFSGSFTVAGLSVGDAVTATATDASGNTSEFAANVTVSALSVSGTVFEDLNYGGGAGRSRAAASGVGVVGARVELYNSSGTYVSATTTASDGSYTFSILTGNDGYFVRVVNSTVLSARSGSAASLVPVLTYRTEAPTGAPAAVTNEVGGVYPASVDGAAGSSGSSLWTSCATEGGTCSFTGTRIVRYGSTASGTSGWATLVLTGGTACNNGVFVDPNPGYVKTCYLLNSTVQSLSTVYVGSASVGGNDFGFNFDTVVNTNDSGAGSLRQAITNANTLAGDSSLAQSGRTAAVENLVFMVSNGSTAAGLRSSNNYFVGGIATIAPTSVLPTVSATLVIDARTQPGWTSAPVIELNGSGAGAGINGLNVSASSTTLAGLVINRYTGSGIAISGGTGSTVVGNYLGTNAAGTAAAANGGSGVYLTAGTHTIGGTSAADRNLISGNSGSGVWFSGAGGNVIGNTIGTNLAGSAAIANGKGVYFQNGSGGTVGGTAAGAGNLISGNNESGIYAFSGGAITITGNTIGLNVGGTAAIANAVGVTFQFHTGATIGGTTAAARNVISGNTGAGVNIVSHGSHTIAGNYIGPSASGAAAIPNGGGGVVMAGSGSNVVGGTAAGAGNVISGNTGIGLKLSSPSNTVAGNLIGLKADGSAALPNTSHGISVSAASNTLGGSSSAARNVIAGNGGAGIDIASGGTTTTVRANFIGLNAAGTAAIGNTGDGVTVTTATGAVIGGATAGMGNAVGGNGGNAITLASSSGHSVLGNTLGLTGDGSAQLAATGGGIVISSTSGSTIGGVAAGSGNTIRLGSAKGVSITGSTSTGNTVRGNAIYGSSGLGIDLLADGITANDGATTTSQPNLLMDAPVFSSASLSGTTLTVAGYVGSAAGQSAFASATVDVYLSDASSANGAGQTWLGTLTADASGNFSGSITGVSGVTAGTSKITATATDGSGNTSEFGPNVTAGYGVSGTVYEDLNYGGGAGRNKLAASGGSGRSGARVELYTVSGSTATYSTSTTTDGLGAYTFSGLAAGNYAVRVVGASVSSSRSGYTAALLPVLTYRADASSGTASAVTDHVGGTSPSATAAGNAAAASTFSIFTGMFSAGPTGAAQTYSLATVGAGGISGLDFGFNFNTVVNVNDSGAGSLRQAITNANTLGGDSSLAQSGRTAGIENLVFMISNGSTVAGLRSSNNYFSGGVATVAAASALPTVTSPLVMDAQTQPGWSLAPIVELNGAGAGSVSGLVVNAAGSQVRGFIVNRFAAEGITSTSGAGLVIQGNYVGLNAGGTAASANGYSAIWINQSAGGHLIGGTTAAQRNVLSGQTTYQGVAILGGSGNTVQGNYIGTNAAGTAVVANASDGVKLMAGVTNSSIGGSAAGAGNLIRGNGGRGVVLLSGATGNAILGNSIVGNTNIGIDLNADGASANDGAKSNGTANLTMDTPVFTAASVSGTTLTVAGYVGSVANQATFAAARVEVFIADGSSRAGQGQTYLGFVTTDASGNFSGTVTGVTGVTNGSTQLTGTATDGSNNTSEFGANVTVGLAVSGTVFEDANYGGGAGRSLATSGGTGVGGATLELYDSSGVYVSTTSSGSDGAYSFGGLAAGTYHLRVVSSSVRSPRNLLATGLLPVLTFRTTATSGSAVAVTDFVGGTNPAFADPGAASAGAAFSTSTYAYSNGLSGTAHAVAAVTVGSASIASVDFGFNFDTVSNTNASGAGSLRQAITNANSLDGDASLAQSGRPAGTENIVFMIPNGTAGAGLRSTFNYFVSGVATISPTTGLPTVSSALVIDAQTQPGWAGTNPIVRLSGTSAGTADGLTLDAANCTVRGLIVGGFTGAGLMVNSNASGSAVQGNWLGLAAAGSSANANSRRGLEVNGVNGLIVGGTTAARRNVIAGNSMEGVLLNGTANVVVTGNYIGTNAAGTAAVANGGNGGMYLLGGATASTIGGTATGAGNVISGNALRAITIETGTHTLQGNTIGLNAAGTAALVNSGGSAIYLSGTAGAQTIGGTTAAARNVIVSTTYHGINVAVASAAGTTIQGNYIGTDAAGTTVLGSGTGGLGGVFINGAGTGIAVGGTAAGAGNLIRGYGSGVLVVSGNGSAILGNSTAGNSGLGIDLNGNGVTANDGVKTTGQANVWMDSPVFTSARATGNQLVVGGYIGTAAGQSVFGGARVEVFLSDNDSTGFGEGKTYLGALTADGSGNFSGTLTLPVSALAIGSQLTATATDGASNTSEFGANFSGLIVDLVVNDPGDTADATPGDGLCATAGGVCTLRAAIAELNAWASLATPPTIAFALPGCSSYGAAACTITPASALPSVTRAVLIDGSTQAGFSTVTYSPIVEISGAAAPGGTTGLVVSASNATVRGLAINRFPGNGITLSGSGNTLVGMRIGLAAASATAAANGGAGTYISGTGSVIGGATAADRNVIAGNGGAGITVAASSTTISGNLIGTDASATTGLGNGGSGIAVLSASLTGVAISGNTLANNAGSGVGVAAGGAAQVQVLANAMSGNSGLGIDLGDDGVTANTGVSNASLPNNGINMPVITGAGVGSSSNAVTVYGYIGTGTGQAAFAGARVEFFKAAADSSGYGEGLVYLGFLTADSNGRFSGTVAYSAGALNVGDALTATATSAAGHSSEFGPNWTTTSVAALTPGNFNAFDAVTPSTALTGTITSKVAGTAASFAVIALDNSGTALHPGFTGTVSLNWVDARDDSGALSGSCRASWVDKGSAGSATFSNNARVTVALTPPASGTRVMRLKMTYTGGGSTVTACSNDAFADLPASYSWTGASDADSATAGTARALDNTAASGGVVHRAGRPFSVRARALDATGALMTGYDGSPALAAAGCLLPSGCTAAALTAPSTATLAGAYTNNGVSYAEVGALQVQLTDASYADVDAADTALGVRTLTSTLLPVGRFIPDSLSVAVSTSGQLGTANAACLASGAGATFIGQGFGWATAPQVTVTALNAAGATTTRWTGSLMKLAAGAGLTEVLSASNTGSATFTASYGTVTVADLGAGQARVTASSTDRFLLDLASGSVQDSVTPTFAWTLGVSDASEAPVAGNPTLAATANQGSVAFNSGGTFHSGRLALSPGYGDVRSGPRLLAQLQRYTAAGWVTMTEDQGCVTIQNENVAVETPTGVFGTLGSCVAPMAGSVTTRGGRAWLAFPGTPAGAPGRLTLRLAGPAATGASCTTAGAAAALVPLSQNWLLGGASAVGPQALATWGKPQRDALLRRETW